MKQSVLFGKTSKTIASDIKAVSHKFLIQAGYIAESVAGRYYFLPLGLKVRDKIKAIIKEEMDLVGGQEMITPTLHPVELWQETNRTNTTGFELMKVTDRRGAEFALGGTAEEMFVDVVRKMVISYKDLPFNVYQFSTKFRDELRARGGLLRVREFMMKDAYTFDRNEEEFKKTYQEMMDVYTKIFNHLALDTYIVASDNGYIGGEYCHEFQVEADIGEDIFFISEKGDYIANKEIVEFKREDKNLNETEQLYKKVDVVRGNTMEDGVKFHGLPLWQQIKDVMYVDEDSNEMILAIIRGDLDVNEIKLKKLIRVINLRLATEDEIRTIGSEPGFISPVGLKGKVKIIGDISLRTIKNAYGGGNVKNRDALNMNIDRDYVCDIEGDIAMAYNGALTEDGQKLIEKKGIEVGNIFQLGYHYSDKMKGAEFTDQDGKKKKYYMGCYGIGLDRTMAAIVEKHHDEKGIIWPENIAPFLVHLISLGENEELKKASDKLYQDLLDRNIEVLYDDRDISAGEKFADSDLIGIPYRIILSGKTFAKGEVEIKKRGKDKIEFLELTRVAEFLKNKLKI